MKKLLIYTAITTILFSLSSIIQAGTIRTSSDQIKSYRVGSNNLVTVYLGTRNTVNPANCERDYPVQVSQAIGKGVSEKAYDQMLTAIIAAKHSNSSVVFFIFDDRCSGRYPSIGYVEVQ